MVEALAMVVADRQLAAFRNMCREINAAYFSVGYLVTLSFFGWSVKVH